MKELLEELIEDYERRVETLKVMIKDNPPPSPRAIRLETKLSTFKTFISELERIIDTLEL